MIYRDYKDYFNDILGSILKIEDFIERLSFEEFINDSKTQYAVVRALEIIGEASKKIPDELKNKYTEIPWRYMTGMSDKLIHGYFGVDANVIWKTVTVDLKTLKVQLEKIIVL